MPLKQQKQEGKTNNKAHFPLLDTLPSTELLWPFVLLREDQGRAEGELHQQHEAETPHSEKRHPNRKRTGSGTKMFLVVTLFLCPNLRVHRHLHTT